LKYLREDLKLYREEQKLLKDALTNAGISLPIVPTSNSENEHVSDEESVEEEEK
jgi:hypothetical protein